MPAIVTRDFIRCTGANDRAGAIVGGGILLSATPLGCGAAVNV
jgi:hypothetical protein